MACILIVDDRPTNRRYLCQVLACEGHRIVEAANGAEALARVRDGHPDLVITDLLMPVMDGLEFMRHLRADPEIAPTRVVFYTATYRSADAHKLAETYGVSAVLPKPTGPRLLLDTVSRLLGIDAASTAGADADASPSALGGLGRRLAGHIGQAQGDRAQTARVQRSASRMFALIELALDLAAEREQGAFLRMFCEASRRIVDAGTAALVLLAADERSVRHVEAQGLSDDGVHALFGPDVHQGLIGRVWHCDGAVREGDGAAALAGLAPAFGGPSSFLGVPLGPPASRRGVLLFTDGRAGHAFDDEDEMMALALAAEFSVMFELFDANESLQRRAVELQLEIAQRQQAEQETREALARLDGMIRAAMDAIVTIDASRRVVLFNPAAERMFGRPASEVLGSTLDRLLPTTTLAAHPQRAGDPASPLRTVHGVRASGEVFPIDLSVSQSTLASGTFQTAILRDVTQRVRADQALEQYRVELAGFSQRLLEQEKQTTRRIAQALHDELGQTLAAMRLVHDAGRARANGGDMPRELAQRLGGLIAEANRQVRQVLTELRPPLLDERGLAAALDNELRQRQAVHQDVTLRLDVPAALDGARWPAEVEYAAFMVAREALYNALRHAQASLVTVAVGGDGRCLELCVRDDGRGMTGRRRGDRPGHFGMVGMRERSHAIGATLNIESGPGAGTTVRLQWGAPP